MSLHGPQPQVLKKVGDRKPWKYIDSVSVEGLTFGLAPPQFQFANAKYDPIRQNLQVCARNMGRSCVCVCVC